MKQLLAIAMIAHFTMVINPSHSQNISEILSQKYPSGSEPALKHADPVYNDFSTDLGAKKGSGQVNLNFGYQNMMKQHHEVLAQLEIEYAPVDNLGFELLLPYNLYLNNDLSLVERPGNRLEFLQWSSQFTFLTSHSKKISMALGFTNSFEMESPEPSLRPKSGLGLKAINYSPFLTFAKNWKDSYFFSFSGGPDLTQELEPKGWKIGAQLNTSFHYGFSKDHYLGIEFNKEISDGSFDMVIRPQVTLQLGEKFTLGGAVGIPAWVEDSNWSAFLRFAYELD